MEPVGAEIHDAQPGRSLPRTDRIASRRWRGYNRCWSESMRNIWTVCRRELYAYFVSPIAWVLLTIFALLSGAFTYLISAAFMRASLESQMSGQTFPMNVNEQVIAPLFSNMAVVGLFLIPLISMRLFAEEKRQGTIELLATSPVHDLEIIIGKWL